jgi:small subunit ribosomal protein S16
MTLRLAVPCPDFKISPRFLKKWGEGLLSTWRITVQKRQTNSKIRLAFPGFSTNLHIPESPIYLFDLMAVAIRLRQEGSKGRLFYRVVAADKRFKRDGRFIEILGTYNPQQKGDNANIDLEKVNAWISKGAQPSDTVRSLIKKVAAAAK